MHSDLIKLKKRSIAMDMLKTLLEWHSEGVPSGYVKIAIENGPVEIVDFPIKNGDFP